MSLVEDTRSLIARATTMTVTTPPTRQDAATLWSLIRSARKNAETEQDLICSPLKTAYEDARKPYLELRKECENWETRLQVAMGQYDREQDRLAQVEQARLQAIVDKANAKIEAKAEAKGVEAVLKVAAVVQAPARNIATQAGTVQNRSTRKVYHIKSEQNTEIFDWDASMVPVAQLLKDFPHLFELNRVKFNTLAKTGLIDGHPNVTIAEEYVYSQR